MIITDGGSYTQCCADVIYSFTNGKNDVTHYNFSNFNDWIPQKSTCTICTIVCADDALQLMGFHDT
jgi:hypothetical protein